LYSLVLVLYLSLAKQDVADQLPLIGALRAQNQNPELSHRLSILNPQQADQLLVNCA
jgi:hypothetical protein